MRLHGRPFSRNDHLLSVIFRYEKSAYLFYFRNALIGIFCWVLGKRIKICRYKKRRSVLSCGTKRFSAISLSVSVEILDLPNVHVCPHTWGSTNRLERYCFYTSPNLLLWGHYIGYSNQPPFTFFSEVNQDVVISLLLLRCVKFISNTAHTDNIIWNVRGYFEFLPQPTHYVMNRS